MYDYQKEKHGVFTLEGTKMMVSLTSNIRKHIELSGAVRMQEAMAHLPGLKLTMLACADYLAELQVLREITNRKDTAVEQRVFVAGPKYSTFFEE